MFGVVWILMCLAVLFGGEEMMLDRLRELHKGARIARNGDR